MIDIHLSLRDGKGLLRKALSEGRLPEPCWVTDAEGPSHRRRPLDVPHLHFETLDMTHTQLADFLLIVGHEESGNALAILLEELRADDVAALPKEFWAKVMSDERQEVRLQAMIAISRTDNEPLGAGSLQAFL